MASANLSPKTIIFKCDQHAAIISEKLQNFYEQNEFFDTALIAGSNSITIQAHRVVLCAWSEYFLEIFRGDQLALKGNVVELKQIQHSTLKLIIDFMYSGSIELSVEMVEGILRTASFLKIKSLVDGCCQMIEKNIDSSNSLSWFRLGYELSLSTLKTKAQECVYTHFHEISKETEFLMLSENELKDLLFNDNPCDGDFEEDIFLAMVAWLNFDELNRKHLILQLLSMVHFQALTPKFIIENRKSVCKTIETYEMICSWLQWHLSPDTRSNDQENCIEAGSNNQQDCTLKLRKEKVKTKKLAIIRGSDNGQINIKTFNPKENVWSTKIERYRRLKKNFGEAIAIDGKIIIRGQNDSFEFLDLHTAEWIDLPLMKQTRAVRQMTDLKGNLCVVGVGINDNLISMEIYNFSTCKWHNVQPLVQPTFDVKMATHSEMLYLLDLSHGRLQSYNVSLNQWTLQNIEKYSPNYYEFAAVEGFLYIIGGYSYAASKWVKTVKRFNLSNDSWCEVASLPLCTISGLRSTVFENKIIVSDSENFLEYNPDSDKWNTLSTCSTKNDYLYNFNICYLPANS